MSKKITPSQIRRLQRRAVTHRIARHRQSFTRIFKQKAILSWLQSLDIRNEFWFLFVEGGI
jgi:hypothetical protein